MKLPTKPIQSAVVGFSGDKTAGIFSSSFEIQMYFDPKCISEDDLLDSLKEIKDKIVDAYEAITGERGNVMFDYEIKEAQEKIDAAMTNQPEVCQICNHPGKLRECYYFKNQDKFDRFLFVPRLMIDEKYHLKSGTNSICENRTRCRANWEKDRKAVKP